MIWINSFPFGIIHTTFYHQPPTTTPFLISAQPLHPLNHHKPSQNPHKTPTHFIFVILHPLTTTHSSTSPSIINISTPKPYHFESIQTQVKYQFTHILPHSTHPRTHTQTTTNSLFHTHFPSPSHIPKTHSLNHLQHHGQHLTSHNHLPKSVPYGARFN